MKNIFLLGKGGVGKSTLACLAAAKSESLGRKTALLSFDPAHNLRDIIRNEKTPFYWKEIEQDRLREDYFKELKKMMKSKRLTGTFFEGNFFDETLACYPGMEEWVLYRELRDQLSTPDYDVKIFDMPPTGMALKLLLMGDFNLNWLKSMIKLRKKIIEKKRRLNLLPNKDMKLEDDPILLKMIKEEEREKRTWEIFRRKETKMIVVENDDILSREECKRIQRSLKEGKFNNVNVLLNNVESVRGNKIKFVYHIKDGKRIFEKKNPFPGEFI